MKFNVGKWTAVVLLSIFMLSCTSIRARTEILQNNQWGVYPGVQQDVKEMQQLAAGEHPESSKDNHSESGWMKGILATILVIDLPFSTIFDTLAVPYDLYRKYNPQKFKENHASSNSNSSPSAEDREAP